MKLFKQVIIVFFQAVVLVMLGLFLVYWFITPM